MRNNNYEVAKNNLVKWEAKIPEDKFSKAMCYYISIMEPKAMNKDNLNITYNEFSKLNNLYIEAIEEMKQNQKKYKVIKEFWMATDKNDETYLHIEYPNKNDNVYYSDFNENIYLDNNVNNQTFDDEPIKVKLIIED